MRIGVPANPYHKELRIIEKIFNPFGGGFGGEDGLIIAALLKNNRIKYTLEKVKILEKPENTPIQYGGGRETDNHINLKYTITQLLRMLGDNLPEVETYYFYDVFSPKFNTRIECGHTHPSRLINSIREKENFWILQYPDCEEEYAILYKFFVEKGVKETISQYIEERMRKISNRLW